MKTVMGIPKTAKHPTKRVKGPTKKGERPCPGPARGGLPAKKGYRADLEVGRGRTAGHARRHGFTLHYDLTVLGLI